MLQKYIIVLLLVVFIAGCTAPVQNTQSTAGPVQATAFLPVVEGAGKGTAYPVVPVEVVLPTAYPGADVVVSANPYPQPEGETAANPEVPEGAALLFARSGGIAGLNERWVVYGDGRIVDVNGAETKVDPAAVTAVLQIIQASGFEAFQGQYGDNSGADKIATTLAVRMNGAVKAVTHYDGAENVPVAMDAILAQVKALLGLQY